MLKYFDFECAKCSHVFEELVEQAQTDLPCTLCKGTANRLIAAPRLDVLRMGLDPAFPSAYRKWGILKTKHHQTDKGTMRQGKAPNLLMY